jgi:hypothetical protein
MPTPDTSPTAPPSVALEIERAVAALDETRLRDEYWAQDEFLFLPQFLPPSVVERLLEDVERLEPGLNRNYIPRHKKGGSVSHFAIAEDGPSLLAFYHSEVFRAFLSRLVRADLKLCPEEDPHACALYFYTEAGDHMGHHYDTSYYKGARYTVLVGLVQDSVSRLLCRLHARRHGHLQRRQGLSRGEPGRGGRPSHRPHPRIRDEPGDGAPAARLLEPQGRLRLLRHQEPVPGRAPPAPSLSIISGERKDPR